MAFTFKISSKEIQYSGYHKDVMPIVSALETYDPNEESAVIISPLWFSKDLVYYYDYNLFTTYFDEYDSTSKFRSPLMERNIYPIEDSTELPSKPYSEVLFIDDNNANSDDTKGILSELSKKYQQVKHEQFATRNLYYYKSTDSTDERH